ncbi:DNA polymerase-3 subunit epsilon [Paraperlucidibaca baekdonensis]|uniref:DNA polymerase III subunit epsilon n=1 Tax=Paraperlucidibaca baekdonensis TaxID=748120 RepID=A0A3E0H2E6_9GAMM|nr:DNA polymerase III subunit epsilon [Paraperlucidibaca baekdonensis]REH36961.1 DNA polymerase-3 subunit epsilon [Paraperlucidibaca baekdonensis]
MSRQIILDTETTGLDPSRGHRLIELGCLEVVNRRLTGQSFHYYVQPDRDIDPDAQRVHGISAEFLADKPRFNEIAMAFRDFVEGAELVIHNAPFDIGFLNHEMALLDLPPITDICTVLDTLPMARAKHPGQKNNLDALARRYGADNRERTLHGALLDAEILADVYLAMTGGQVGLQLGQDEKSDGQGSDKSKSIKRLAADRRPLPVVPATADELAAHAEQLAVLDANAEGGQCLFRRYD